MDQDGAGTTSGKEAGHTRREGPEWMEELLEQPCLVFDVFRRGVWGLRGLPVEGAGDELRLLVGERTGLLCV